jgi:CMP-N,N'-diacetyllegionaminic acid synthase
MKKNILAITLARGGSKSVPRKNIKILNGLPLIAYTINEAKKSKYINKYIVSTDDEEIKKISLLYGAEVPFLRPNDLATDTASSANALIHAVTFMENKYSIKYDYIIELMCTNPFKTVEDIDKCIEKLVDTNADSVIAVHKLEDHHPLRIKQIIDDHIVDFYLPEPLEARRQDLKPDAYIRSGSIYALKRDYLMDQKKRYGSINSRPYILSENKAVNVDTELDFYLAEQMIKNNF